MKFLEKPEKYVKKKEPMVLILVAHSTKVIWSSTAIKSLASVAMTKDAQAFYLSESKVGQNTWAHIRMAISVRDQNVDFSVWKKIRSQWAKSQKKSSL